MPEPVRPSHLSEYAEKTLAALAAAGLVMRSPWEVPSACCTISITGPPMMSMPGGPRRRSPEDRERVLATVEAALRPLGEVRTRKWGEVVSLELKKEGKTVFSFQIASRSAQLQPPTTLPWSDVALDSLPDLVASKMVALGRARRSPGLPGHLHRLSCGSR